LKISLPRADRIADVDAHPTRQTRMLPVSETLAEQLEQARERVRTSHGRRTGRDIVRTYSDDIDRLLAGHAETILSENPDFSHVRDRVVIYATGGYGRRELNLFSDIDILFLYRGEPLKEDEEFVRAYVYPLFNLKMDLSYSIKTTHQVEEEIGREVDLTTALMGAHAIWGCENLARTNEQSMRMRLSMRYAESLSRQLVEATLNRHKRFSNTVLLLEPNVKEAPGALRDLHVLLWLACLAHGEMSLASLGASGLITPREERDLRRAYAFLLELRNGLHIVDGRKSDQLNFERQIKIAPTLGYDGSDHLLPEEQLMRAYYEHVSVVYRVVRRVFGRIQRDGEHPSTGNTRRMRRQLVEGQFWSRDNEVWVEPGEAAAIARDPMWMMRLFRVSCRHGLHPDDFTRNLVERHTRDIDDAYRESPLLRDDLMAVFNHRRNAGMTLRAMHDCGFLSAVFPEFGLVRNLPRIDYYHQFTVDEHLLRSVDCAVELSTGTTPFGASHAAGVARDVLRFDLLTMALLFHDVGKGEGRGHVIRGAHMIQRISERLDLAPKEREILYSLVANHQKMSNLALRRNIDDPRVSEGLARDINDPELLRMLYVLTCCDLRAVSADSWNDWRGMLIKGLFEHTLDRLLGRPDQRRRPVPSSNDAAQRVLEEVNLLQAARDASGKVVTLEEIIEFIADMPARYRQSTPPAQMARHILLAQGLGPTQNVRLELEPIEGRNYSELHCVAQDAPGLFCNLCGALSSRGFNILSAQVYTARNGTCVDILQIQDYQNQPPTDQGVIDRLHERLNQVLRGEKQSNWGSQLGGMKPVSAARLDLRPPACSISNESDEGYTVIEVKAPDRPGLLYDITTVLDRHQLHLHLALIATESYQVVDVFYVTDWENNRLEPGPKTEQIRKELLEVLSPPEALKLAKGSA
jgi:[protein-PII] uridylyltransferase